MLCYALIEYIREPKTNANTNNAYISICFGLQYMVVVLTKAITIFYYQFPIVADFIMIPNATRIVTIIRNKITNNLKKFHFQNLKEIFYLYLIGFASETSYSNKNKMNVQCNLRSVKFLIENFGFDFAKFQTRWKWSPQNLRIIFFISSGIVLHPLYYQTN